MRKIHIIFIIALIISSFSMVKPTYAQGQNVNEFNNYMWAKINDLRYQEGKNRLALDNELNSYAEIRANEATEKWSHTRPDGTQGVDLVPVDRAAGENLSQITLKDFHYTREEQQAAADRVFESLVESKTHYEVMLKDPFVKVGIKTNVVETEAGTKLVTAYIFSGYRNETKTIIVTIN